MVRNVKHIFLKCLFLYRLSSRQDFYFTRYLSRFPLKVGLMKDGNKSKFELVESSSYPSSSYWGSTVLTIYARAAITSPEVLKEEEEGELEAVLTVLHAAGS